MDLEEQLSNLTVYYDKEEYILLTAAQTQKDLSQFNMDFIITSDKIINYRTLLKTLEPIIRELIESNREKLVQLIYRIDVAENKISEALNLGNSADSINQICHEILQRELKKVLIRKYYAKK